VSESTEPEFLGPRDVARILDVDRRTVRRWIETGELAASRLGPKLIRIRRSELDRFVEDRPA